MIGIEILKEAKQRVASAVQLVALLLLYRTITALVRLKMA